MEIKQSSNKYLELCQNNEQLLDCCTSSNIDENIFSNISPIKCNLYKIINYYPSDKYQKLIQLIKNKFEISDLVLGSGSEDLICRLNNIIKYKNAKSAVFTPIFYRVTETLKNCTKISSKKLFEINLAEYKYVWITNPNPLSGEVISKENLLKIVKKYLRTIFIIDETSILFLPNWQKYSLLKETTKYKNLIVVTSFSKFYGLPGVRIGIASGGNNELFNELKNNSATFPIDNISQKIIIHILQKKIIDKKIRQNINKNKKIIFNILNKNTNLIFKQTPLNFLFVKANKNNLYQKLIDLNILSFKISSSVIRLTIRGSKKINKQLIKNLSKNKI